MAAEYTEEDLNKDMDDFFKDGGVFDQHDVDDNDRITFDEFTKMNDDVAADFQKRYGEWPEYKGKEVKFVYRTHNKFSKGKGITKEDFEHANATVMKTMEMAEKISNWKPTKEMMAAVAPAMKIATTQFMKDIQDPENF